MVPMWHNVSLYKNTKNELFSFQYLLEKPSIKKKNVKFSRFDLMQVSHVNKKMVEQSSTFPIIVNL